MRKYSEKIRRNYAAYFFTVVDLRLPIFSEAAIRRFFSKQLFLNSAELTGKHLCRSLFFNKVADLRYATSLEKETLTQVFSCEFCRILKSSFSCRATPVAASVFLLKMKNLNDIAWQSKQILKGKNCPFQICI